MEYRKANEITATATAALVDHLSVFSKSYSAKNEKVELSVKVSRSNVYPRYEDGYYRVKETLIK